MATTTVTNDEQHRELTNEEDFRQVYEAKVVNIISTPWHVTNPTAGRNADATKIIHDNPQAGIYTFNPNTGLRAAAAAAGMSEAEQGRRWLEIWVRVLHKVKKTRGTCYVMAKGTDEDNFELEGGAQHGEVSIAKGFHVPLEYVFYSLPTVATSSRTNTSQPSTPSTTAAAESSATAQAPSALGDPTASSPERQLALVMERREVRKQQEKRAQENRLTTRPIVVPPTQTSLQASVAGGQAAAGTAQASSDRVGGSSVLDSLETSSSSGSVGSVATIMTVTIEGSLEGPPPFDPTAFTAKLAQTLDMRNEQFSVRRVKSKRSRHAHEVQSSRASGMRIVVDVDEEGYLRHDVSTSGTDSSGSDSSGLSDADKDTVEGGITFAIQKALRPHRPAQEAIEILWTEAGSIIIGLQLDLPYALKLLDLHQRGDPCLEELQIRGCALGERRKVEDVAPLATLCEKDLALLCSELDAEICRIVLAPNYFEVLGLSPSSDLTGDRSSVHRAYRKIARLIHPDKTKQRRAARQLADETYDVEVAMGQGSPTERGKAGVEAESYQQMPDESLAAAAEDVSQLLPERPEPEVHLGRQGQSASQIMEEAEQAARAAREALEVALAQASDAEPGSTPATQLLNEAKETLADAQRCAEYCTQLRDGGVFEPRWALAALEELKYSRELVRLEATERMAAEAQAQAEKAAVQPSNEALAAFFRKVRTSQVQVRTATKIDWSLKNLIPDDAKVIAHLLTEVMASVTSVSVTEVNSNLN